MGHPITVGTETGRHFFLIFGTFEDEHGEDAEQNEDGQFR